VGLRGGDGVELVEACDQYGSLTGEAAGGGGRVGVSLLRPAVAQLGDSLRTTINTLTSRMRASPI